MSAICDAHKKKVCVELLYNSVNTGSQLVWRTDQLETRCCRESQQPAEGALRPPIEQLQLKTRYGRENQHPAEGPLRPRLISWGSDELEIRWGRENQHPERLGPQAPG